MRARRVPARAVLALALGLLALAPAPSPASAAEAYGTDDAVRAALRRVPGVASALAAGQQRRAAVLVNRWLAPRIPAAASGEDVMPTYGRSAHELLDALAVQDRGVFCDGAADALVAALRLLGVEAFRLDFGYATDALTHTTVVVHSGGRYWLVDPTFGMDLEGADGHPLDLAAAWQATADEIRGTVALRTTDLSARAEVGIDGDPDAICADALDRWTMCALRTYLRGFGAAMRRAGYPAGERGLLLLSLRSPLFDPAGYGVPAELLALRAATGAERRPVRVTSTQRAGATLAVTVRNVRGYPAPVVVSAGTEARRATLVPPGGTRRVVLHARGGRLGAPRLTLARS